MQLPIFPSIRSARAWSNGHWPRSGVHAHLANRDDAVTTIEPVLSRTGDFAAFLDEDRADGLYDPLRRADAVGRPLGSVDFMAGLENRLKRRLFPQKRGLKPKADDCFSQVVDNRNEVSQTKRAGRSNENSSVSLHVTEIE